MILGERKTAQNEMITLSDDEDTCISPHITPTSDTHKHTITSQSPSPLHFTPGGNPNTDPHTITSHSPPHFTPGTHIIASQSHASHHMTPATNYPMQHTLPTPTQSFHIDPHEPSFTPLSCPIKHYPRSFTQQLMEIDFDILLSGDQSAPRKLSNSEVGSN